MELLIFIIEDQGTLLCISNKYVNFAIGNTNKNIN
jgi:hypothetical protein